MVSWRSLRGRTGESRVQRPWLRRASVAVVALAVTGIAAVPVRAESSSAVDLNRATLEELTALPGIGPAKAQAIIDHRGNAPFKKPEELLQVRGIGDALYAQLKDRVTVGASGAEGAGGGGAAAGERAAGAAGATKGAGAGARAERAAAQ